MNFNVTASKISEILETQVSRDARANDSLSRSRSCHPSAGKEARLSLLNVNCVSKLSTISFLLMSSVLGTLQAAELQHVQRLLEQAEGKDQTTWAALLIDADAQATNLEKQNPEGCCGYRCVRIRQYVLTFGWNEQTGREVYQHDLLKTVIRACQGTFAGAHALAKFLQPGCGTALLTSLNVPYYKLVLDILELPVWRKESAAALIRIKAEAYETWWSLSQASGDEPEFKDNNLTPADFVLGAEIARQRAIVAYQELLRKVPGDKVTMDHLHKLRASQDTHQRRWYCFAD